MRFVYLILVLLVIANWIILILNNLLEINIYKKYGKKILKGFWQFLMFLAVVYIAISLSGLGS